MENTVRYCGCVHGVRYGVYIYVLGRCIGTSIGIGTGSLWSLGTPPTGVANFPNVNCYTISSSHLAAFRYNGLVYVLGSVSSFATDLFGFRYASYW
jgi:hypothetical protein